MRRRREQRRGGERWQRGYGVRRRGKRRRREGRRRVRWRDDMRRRGRRRHGGAPRRHAQRRGRRRGDEGQRGPRVDLRPGLHRAGDVLLGVDDVAIVERGGHRTAVARRGLARGAEHERQRGGRGLARGSTMVRIDSSMGTDRSGARRRDVSSVITTRPGSAGCSSVTRPRQVSVQIPRAVSIHSVSACIGTSSCAPRRSIRACGRTPGSEGDEARVIGVQVLQDDLLVVAEDRELLIARGGVEIGRIDVGRERLIHPPGAGPARGVPAEQLAARGPRGRDGAEPTGGTCCPRRSRWSPSGCRLGMAVAP